MKIWFLSLGHLIHADDSCRGEVVTVSAHFIVEFNLLDEDQQKQRLYKWSAPAHLQTAKPGIHGGELCKIRGIRCKRVASLAGGDLPQGLRAADQLVQGLHDAGEARSVGTLLLPAVKHQLVDCFWTVHGSRQAVTLQIKSCSGELEYSD